MRSKSVHKNSWKFVQSKKKLKQKTKLALIVLGFIIILMLSSQIFKFTKTLNSSWQMNSKKSYTWDGHFNINLILRSKSISLVSYNPTDNKIIIVDIPDQTYLEAAHGFGKWQARALFDLGGDKLLKDSLEDFFAQPIDGFLDLSAPYKDRTSQQIIELIRQNPIGGLNLLSSLKTDLTLMELIRLKFGLSSVRFDKLIQIDLQKRGVLQKDHLLDGTEIFTADPNKIDLILADLADPKIKNEHKSIAIFNGTEQPFFAQKYSRLVSNMGGDVIIVSNAQKRGDKTLVWGERGDTLKRFSQLFSSCKSAECDKILTQDEDIAESRGQINIKLAPDLLD